MITKIFLTTIALIIPFFFVSLFVMSAYHRLSALRRRCAELAAEAESADEPGKASRLRVEHATAVTAYNQARSTFPTSWLGGLFGFPRAAQTLATPDSR